MRSAASVYRAALRRRGTVRVAAASSSSGPSSPTRRREAVVEDRRRGFPALAPAGTSATSARPPTVSTRVYGPGGRGLTAPSAANWSPTSTSQHPETSVSNAGLHNLSLDHSPVSLERAASFRSISLGSNGSCAFEDEPSSVSRVSLVEALGLERSPPLGLTQGGAVVSSLRSRTCRTSREPTLVLCSAYARGLVSAVDVFQEGTKAFGSGVAPQGQLGQWTTQPSARCSPRSFCPTAPEPTGRPSISCSGAPLRRRKTQYNVP